MKPFSLLASRFSLLNKKIMKSTILIILLLTIIALPSQAAASNLQVVSEDTDHGVLGKDNTPPLVSSLTAPIAVVSVSTNNTTNGRDRFIRRQVRNSQKPHTKSSKRTSRSIYKHTKKGGRR